MSNIPKDDITGNPCLQEALASAKRGWRVHPNYELIDGRCSCPKGVSCSTPGKHPRLSDWVRRATTDETTIREWWGRWPGANLGIATGAESGLVVLDVDPAKGGEESLDDLQVTHSKLPSTVEVITGSGGRHIYLLHPGNGTKIHNSASDLGPGLDIRADGGQVVAPPSFAHRDGRRYHWEAASHPDDVAVAPMPEWLYKLLTAPTEHAGGNGHLPQANSGAVLPLGYDALDFVANGAPVGQQRERAVRAARNYLSSGHGVEETSAAVWRGLQASTWEPEKGPWTLEDALAIVTDLASKPAPAPKPLPPCPTLKLPQRPVTAEQQPDSSATTKDWEPPVPFYSTAVPEFPTDVFPAWLRAFVEAEAIATQTPADLAGMLALSILSTACAKKVVVLVRGHWQEPVNVFTAIALPSGERKTAVFMDAVAPIEAFEKEKIAELTPKVAEAEAKYRIAKSRLEHAQAQAAKAKRDEAAELVREATELACELATMTVPAMPQFIVDDCTPERLATLLRDQGGRMAVLADEGDVFDLMAGRYSERGANFGAFLRGHSGDNIRVDRVGRPPEFVRRPALTMGLAVQPDVIRGLTKQPGFRGRGLLARFLYSWPRSLVGRRDIEALPMPESIRERYHQAVLALLALPFGTDDAGDPAPHVLRLDPIASQMLQRFAAQVEPQLSEFGELGMMTDWGGKLVGAVVRIAGLLHMAESCGETAPWQRLIGFATIEAAIRLGQYLASHARLAFAEMGADENIEAAKRILRWIEKAGVDSFTKRACFEATKGHFKRVEAMEPAIKLLEAHAYIRDFSKAKQGPGRKPSPVYEVNPLLNSANSANIASTVGDLKTVEDRPGKPSELSAHPEEGNVLTARSGSHNSHNSHNSRPDLEVTEV